MRGHQSGHQEPMEETLAWITPRPAGAGFISVLNLTALEALPTTSLVKGQLAFVQVTSLAAPSSATPPQPSYWAFYPAGYAPPDGAVTVSASGGGVWAYVAGGIAGEIQVYPLETGADDWPALNAVLVAAAGNVAVRLMPGTWQAKSIQPIPSGTTLRATPDTIILASLAGQHSGTAQTAALTANVLTAGADLGLTADIVAGSNQVPVASVAGIVAGTTQVLLFDSATDHGQQYLVVDIVGMVLTLDRSVYFDYPLATSTCQPILTLPHDIDIDLSNAQLSGTGAWNIAFSGGLRVYVRNIIITQQNGYPTDGGGGIWLLDTASLDCVIERIYIPNVPVGVGGFLASCERTTVTHFVCQGALEGYVCNLSANCDIEAYCDGCTLGAEIQNGNNDIRWTGTYNSNFDGGMVVDGINISGQGATLDFNEQFGPAYEVSNAFSFCSNPTLTDCQLNANYQGITVGTCTGFRAVQVDCRNNLSTNISITTTAIGPSFTAYDASSTIPALDVLAASNTHPIVIETGDGLGNPAEHGLGAVGATASVNIAGVTGNAAANGTNLVATVLSPTTFSIPPAGSGAYTGGGTVQPNTLTGLNVLADTHFEQGTIRGNFGGGSAVTVTACHATFDGLFAELDSLTTGTFGTVTTAGRVDLQNAYFDFELSTGAFIWSSDNSSMIYVGPNVKAGGTTAGTEGAGFNSSGLVVIENSVDLSAVRSAFLEFGGGVYPRIAHSPNAPFAIEWTNVSVASAVDVTLTTAQQAYPGLALTGVLGGNINLVFAEVAADYEIDPSGFTPGAFALTLKCGAATTAMPSTTKLFRVRTTATPTINTST